MNVPESFSFPSCDNHTTLHAQLWLPNAAQNDAPKAIIQIVHGMSEHIGRYLEFASFLSDLGFVVTGDDHIGHGKSAGVGERGCLPAKNGADILVEDEKNLHDLCCECMDQNLPYFMLGHSLGSFITRVYISRYGNELAGAIICGTGSPSLLLTGAGGIMASTLSHLKGDKHLSEFIHSMGTGAYSTCFEGETGYEWLSRNSQNVQDFCNDEDSGFMFSVGGYATVSKLCSLACSAKTAKAVPNKLPLLFVSGAEDPVGDMGKGVIKAYRLAKKCGSLDVSMRIYDHMRHEILNEDEHETVFRDLAAWIDSHLTSD